MLKVSSKLAFFKSRTGLVQCLNGGTDGNSAVFMYLQINISNIFQTTELEFTYTSEFSGMSRAFRFLPFSTVTLKTASLKVYFNLI